MILTCDLGGTRMRGARVDGAGVLSDRAELPTPAKDPTPEGFVSLLKELAPGCDRAVLGLPARIARDGTIAHAPNLPAAWRPLLTRDRLAEALGLPIELANDADLAAVGEAWFGAARGREDIVFLTFSTGVGAGVLLGRQLLRGRHTLAEVGHIVIDLPAATRGAPSTPEELASGTALGRLAAQVGIKGGGEEIVRRLDEPVARGVFDRVALAAAITVQNLAFLFSPEIVVVGGGLGLVGEPFLAPIRTRLARHGPPDLGVEVVNAELGGDAGLIGAAAWEAATRRSGSAA